MLSRETCDVRQYAFFIYNLECRDLELVWVYFGFLEYSTIFSRLKDSFLS